MVSYRRNFVPGGTFFFTVALHNRKTSLLTDYLSLLKLAFQQVKNTHPFKTKAYVVLPEHMHLLWELPEDDFDFSIRLKKIKALFTKFLVSSGLRISKTKHDEYRLGQRRFWEHTIRNAEDYENHVNYIHYNPIKHGLVDNLTNWPHSSFHYYVEKGMLDKNWGRLEVKLRDLNFGE